MNRKNAKHRFSPTSGPLFSLPITRSFFNFSYIYIYIYLFSKTFQFEKKKIYETYTLFVSSHKWYKCIMYMFKLQRF